MLRQRRPAPREGPAEDESAASTWPNRPSSSPSSPSSSSSFLLARKCLLQLLGLVFFFAFLSTAVQGPALIGADGLLPGKDHLARVHAHFRVREDDPIDGAARLAAAAALPCFWHWVPFTDTALVVMSGSGALMGLLLALLPHHVACAPLLALLWTMQLSLVAVGQTFWGFGWESQLLETTFLAVFLAPLKPGTLLDTRPHWLNVFLFRFLLARIMLGAGLIKLRSHDSCWTELRCMDTFYETAPEPNAVSWFMHNLPAWVHTCEVAVNHMVELAVPLLCLVPVRAVRRFAGIVNVAFQLILCAVSNLSFLNHLTIVPAVALLDDTLLAPLHASATLARVQRARPVSRMRTVTAVLVTALVAVLARQPLANLVSPHQVMNTSFDAFRLVNTYGAFGTVSKVRREVVIQVTDDAPVRADSAWVDVEIRCKPGNVSAMPCQTSPYHERLAWQMWFAAMQRPEQNGWLKTLMVHILQSSPTAARLTSLPLAHPTAVRAVLYDYRFTTWHAASGDWWTRQPLSLYIPPFQLK